MNRPRHSIVSLMWIVGLVALNLAVGRTIALGEPWRLAGICLIGATIQLALFFLNRARGRPRPYAFCLGFEICSLLGLWSFLYARVPESRVGSLWDDYGAFIDGLLRHQFNVSVFNLDPFDPVLLTTVAIFAFIPQLLMGISGGLLALCIAWSQRSRAFMIALFSTVGFVILNIAVWLGAWSALPAQPPWLTVGVTPSGLMLQWGLFRLIQRWRQPRSRVFWIGFLVAGSFVLRSYFRAMIFTGTRVALYFAYWPGGPWYVRPIRKSPLWTVWTDYTALASYCVGLPPMAPSSWHGRTTWATAWITV